ncbi:ABC transporter substrate-binding protein [Klenkia sp. LSe6-5]|uniref:ABC transporter substrate-binding protein n=1 Tax=Klenkia sesuvii TaxID=3103137 RepID=A0ABU8DSZ4_9ACTN
MKHRVRAASLSVAALALAACSTTAPTSSGGGGGDDVTTGNGVTDSTITVGVLTDLSGPFSGTAGIQVAGFQAYWDQVNADGGICDRDVTVDVQDHGYDPQKAVTLYRSAAPDIIALQQVLGGPTSAAVLPLAEQDGVYVGGVGWAGPTLVYDNNQLPGATYGVAAANAVDYMVDELDVPEGSTVGVVHFAGDYGGDALAGAEHAADERGLQVLVQEINPTNTDLSAQASALAQADVAGVVLAAAPTQLASLAGVLSAQGADVPVFAMGPAFNPSILATPAGPALESNVYVLTSSSPFVNPDSAGVQTADDLYTTADPDGAVGWEVPLAYVQAELLRQALEGACDAGDLTPEGVVTAFREGGTVDTQGVLPDDLDYAETGQSPSRTVFLSRASGTVDGGLELVEQLSGPSAESFSYGS